MTDVADGETVSTKQLEPESTPVQPSVGTSLPNSANSSLRNGTASSQIPSEQPLSKNQQKKLKRKQEWEDGRAARKAKRKEKTKEKKERRRASHQETAGSAAFSLHQNAADAAARVPQAFLRAIQLPVTFVFDCQYEDLMTEGERISLASQLTRAYSDNRRARFRAHLVVSSFVGGLKERYEGILANSHQSWRGVRFLEDDFMTAAEQAKDWMAPPGGGRIAGALEKHAAVESLATQDTGEVVYLSSDSSETLTALKPYSTYIIGGLVDRNRHKGACYKKAMDAEVKTAKLPIGDFLKMSSRAVLATNHVCEIMLKWLEVGDWGKSFMEVIPKRKGGVLKDEPQDGVSSQADREMQAEDEGTVHQGQDDEQPGEPPASFDPSTE